MTGAEHFNEAERLIETIGNTGAETAENIARAQVHATLALASATAHNDMSMPTGSFGWPEDATTDPTYREAQARKSESDY